MARDGSLGRPLDPAHCIPSLLPTSHDAQLPHANVRCLCPHVPPGFADTIGIFRFFWSAHRGGAADHVSLATGPKRSLLFQQQAVLDDELKGLMPEDPKEAFGHR